MGMFVMAVETATWNFVGLFFFYGSIVLYFLAIITLSSFGSLYLDYFFVAFTALDATFIWSSSMLVGVAVLVLELVCKMFRLEFYPTLIDIGIECDHGHGNVPVEQFEEYLERARKQKQLSKATLETAMDTVNEPSTSQRQKMAARSSAGYFSF